MKKKIIKEKIVIKQIKNLKKVKIKKTMKDNAAYNEITIE